LLESAAEMRFRRYWFGARSVPSLPINRDGHPAAVAFDCDD
jgi:hypothetical protein